MVFFKAERHVDIPTKDLISWIFDSPQYDQDKPVSKLEHLPFLPLQSFFPSCANQTVSLLQIYIDPANPSNFISCNQARTIVRKLVAGLRAAGVQKGDCVCIHSFNDIYYCMIFLGVIAAGGVFAGTNPSYTQYELVHHIKCSKSRFLITEPEMLEPMLAAAKECNVPRENMWIFNVLGQAVPEGFKSWKELLQCGEEDWVRFDDLETSKNTTAARLFSSGTTGLPKAAMISHYNFVAQHTLVFETNPKPYDVSQNFFS